METTPETLLGLLPAQTVYVLVRWPFFESWKEHHWFEDECVYYGSWDEESIIKAYFVPLKRLVELHRQGDPELFFFTVAG